VAAAPVQVAVAAIVRAPQAVLDDDEPDDEGPPRTPVGGAALDYYSLARDRGLSLRDLRHEVEMQCIKRALLEAKGNISEAARLLQMKRSRLSQIVNAEAELREVAHGD
jgi:DNA-binding NtrC family response regulator